MFQSGFKLSPTKCKFFQQEVNFLGHLITREGIDVNKDKVKIINDWSKPETMKAMRKFLGICGYHRNHIKEYAKIVRLIEELCKEIWNKNSKNSKHQLIGRKKRKIHLKH